MAKVEEELKSLLMKVKEESEKIGLKLHIQEHLARSWHLIPSLHGKWMGQQWKQWQTLFSWAPKSLLTVTTAMKLKRHFLLGRKAMTNLDSILKTETLLCQQSPSSESYDFSSSHVWMWELDYKESWALKNWGFWTMVLESPLDCKEIQPVNPKGNQSWIFIGRTEVEAEIPMLWPPDAKNWLAGKDPDAGKDWKREEKGMREDGWHHRLEGYESE